MLWRLRAIKRDGVPVRVRVIKQKIDWGSNTTASPVFEIISGQYLGETAKSEVGMSFGIHSVGSELDGVYHPDTGAIESQTTLAIWAFFSWMFIAGSLVAILWVHLFKNFVT